MPDLVLPATRAIAAYVVLKLPGIVMRRRSFSSFERAMHPTTNVSWVIRPTIDGCVRICSFAVNSQPWRHQARIVSLFSVIGMAGKQYAQKAASGVSSGFPQTRANFPVHVLPLPCTRTYQDYGHRCVANEVIADSLPDGLSSRIPIVYIPISDRFIHNIFPHHLDEPIFVFLIIVMETDEYPMSWRLRLAHYPTPFVCLFVPSPSSLPRPRSSPAYGCSCATLPGSLRVPSGTRLSLPGSQKPLPGFHYATLR